MKNNSAEKNNSPENSRSGKQSPDDKTAVSSAPVFAAASLFAGLCILVPVPFLDRFLLRHVQRQMTASLLLLNNISSEHHRLFSPLYREHHGCLVRIALLIFVFPFVIIYKIFSMVIRWLFFVLIIRDAAIEMGKTTLLGHTVERCLADGRITAPDENDTKSFRKTFRSAVKCRRCFNKAFKGSDWRLLIHIFRGTVKSLKKSPRLIRVALEIFRKPQTDSDPAIKLKNTGEEERSALKAFTKEIAETLNNREMQEYIKNFDILFDEKW